MLLKFGIADARFDSLAVSDVSGLMGLETEGVVVMVSNLVLFCVAASGRAV
jgi:hypothetical protein